MVLSTVQPRSVAGNVLTVLLTFDAFLILAYGVAKTAEMAEIATTPLSLVLGDAASLGSIAVYAKLLAIVVVARVLSRWIERQGYGYIAFLFGVLFIDDYFELHEKLGKWGVSTFASVTPPGLRPQDVGELVFFTGLLVLAIVLFAVAWRLARGVERDVLKWIIALVVALGYCGVFMDMVHVAVEDVPGLLGAALRGAAGILEDGGEMVVLSLILFVLLRRMLDMARTVESG